MRLSYSRARTFASPDAGSVCFIASGIFIFGATEIPGYYACPNRTKEIITILKLLYPF